MSAGFELPAKDAKKYENTLDFFRISSVFRGHDCLNLTDRQTGFISFENEKIISARSMAFSFGKLSQHPFWRCFKIERNNPGKN